MNCFFNASKTIGLLLLSIFVLTACNDKQDPSVCVITVVDAKGDPIEGATVYVNSDNSTAIIDNKNKVGELKSEEISDSNGKTRHTFTEPGKNKPFALEAVLEVRASKIITVNSVKDTLIGRGSVHLYPSKVVNETITMR